MRAPSYRALLLMASHRAGGCERAGKARRLGRKKGRVSDSPLVMVRRLLGGYHHQGGQGEEETRHITECQQLVLAAYPG